MRFPKINIRREIKLFLLLILAFSAIAFVDRKQDSKKIQELNILIHDKGNNYFLSKEEVHKLITADNSDFVLGNDYGQVDLKTIENRVKQNEYVFSTQAFKDLAGNLTVEIELCKPMARIIRPGKGDKYICESGKIISTNAKYTPRVLLVGGDYLKEVDSGNIAADSAYQRVYQLTRFIHQDPFWKAQIAQMNINKQGDITLYPQVTRQYIEFGKPVNIEDKFLKLEYFYKKILPYKGWNHYARVNLKYENQIICE